MLLNIISGGIGSGKSDCLYGYIKENLKNNPDANAVLVVPEQFSYTAEKTLSEEFGGLGINRLEVLTFSRLIHRYVPQNDALLPSGKAILLTDAASKISEDNVFLAAKKRGGFISALSDLFSEFKRYNISPEDLADISLENPLSAKKLESVNEIYKSYLDFFSGGFADSEDAPSHFAQYIKSSDAFENTFFFIDDYNDFMPQHYDILRSMISSSRGVFVTLTIGSDDADGLFAPVIRTKSRLLAIALSENAQVFTKKLTGNAGYIAAEDIRYLLENWEEKPVFPGKCENIRIFTSRDLYSEVERTAAEIITLVRDKGMRFRDIGVIVGDMQSYLHILNAVFADSGIPFFTDEKLTVTMHPIIRTVMSLFEIISKNWTFGAVFNYLRAGYVYIKENDVVKPLDPEDIDILENYVLSCGIRGKKAWFSPWENSGETVFDDVIDNYDQAEYDLEHLNKLRQTIILPFENFLENKGRTGEAIAKAIYEFLCDINLYEGLFSECAQFDSLGLRDEAEQTRQIWNTVLEVLDQAVITVGHKVISRESFFEYIKNALSACSLSIIPSGLDRVSVGTVQRNSPARVKALFILGVLHGSIPKEPSASAILTPLDRELINEALVPKEKELAPDDLGRISLENLKLYRAVSTAAEKLFISYPASNSEGNALSPAYFVTDLCRMFPDIKAEDNILSEPHIRELLSSPKRGFYYMLKKLSEYYKETPEAIWQSVFDWYSKNPDFADKLSILKAAAKYRRLQPFLSKEKALLLYGKNKKYSITALEKFNKCPFSYYIEKGLRAQPQEVKKIEKSHIGSLLHSAVYQFCKRVEDGATTIDEIHSRWTNLSSEDASAIMANVMNIMREKVLKRAKDDTKQLEYLLSRCARTLEKSVETIRASLSGGGYTAVCYEKDFEVDIDWKGKSVTLIGTIDRIDVIENIEKMRADLRIVDYKSGHKRFSISAIVNKIDMQLVLYAIAASKLYRQGSLEKTNPALSPQLSAILYNKINDDIAKIDRDDPTLAQKVLKASKKLDGIIITDEASAKETLRDMDMNLETAGESDFLNVSYKKDGTLYSSSQVASRETFNSLCDYMRKSVIDTSGRISDGCIDIHPYKSGQNSSCTYCDFADICMFDNTSKNFRKLFSGDDAALEFIKKELDNDE